MKLQHKVSIILLISVGLALIFMLFTTKMLVLTGFEKIEEQQIQKNIETLKEVIAKDYEHLKKIYMAWSTWDDSYQFMKNRNKHFLQTNFLYEAIFDIDLSGVVIIDLNKKIVFSQFYDSKNRQYLKTDPMLLKDIQENLINTIKDGTKTITTGLDHYNGTFSYYSINPILPGSGVGNPNGYMIFFKPMDNIEKIASLMKFKMSRATVDYPSTQEIKSIVSKDNSKFKATVYFPDHRGTKASALTMEIPRTIYQYGSQTVYQFLKFLATIGITVTLVFFFVINLYIIAPILKLKKELEAISQHHSTKKLVSVNSQDEIGTLAAEINDTLNTLNENQIIINRNSKLSALGEMAGSIAHEINNPLTIISGYTTRIRNQIESENPSLILVGEYAKKIQATVFRIEKIIKSLRVIARNGEEDPKAPTQIGDIFDDVYFLSQMTLKEKSINLDLSEFEPSLIVEARSVQIAQVLINLINNSVDAIEKQEHPQIKLATQETDDEIILSVSDSGKISPEIVDKIMTPFFTTKEVGKGTGLGLSISKSILESHGGKLYLDTENEHTCFKLIFPKKKAS